MSLSPQVRAAVDEIRRSQSLVKSLEAERDLWKQKAMDAQAKMDELSDKEKLSDEDRKALEDEVRNLDELNDRLEGAAQANTKPESLSGPVAGGPARGSSDAESAKNAQEIAEQRGRDKEAGPQPVEPIQAPLMPTLAFNPHGSGNPAPAGDGQPNQPQAIETAGGFVIQGGASTQRAPGSRPESPSSSLIVPEDPTAKAPVSTADEVKSGLGDSRGNEQIGNDLRPVDQGPGMPKEPTEAEQKEAQKRVDAINEEMARREANPLNLSPEDLQKRQDEEREREQAKNDREKGVPASDTAGDKPENPNVGPAPAPQEGRQDRSADGGEKRGE